MPVIKGFSWLIHLHVFNRALERGVSVEVKYFTVSGVNLKNTVSSVDLVSLL